MPEPIVYQFVAQGHGDVLAAIRSVTAAQQEAARAAEGFGRGAERGAGSARRGLSEVEKLAKRVAADQEKSAKRASQAQEREAQKAVAAANKGGQAQVRAFEQAAKAAEKAAQRAAAATKRGEDQRWREVERTAAKIKRAMEREAEDAERLAEKKAKAEERARGRYGIGRDVGGMIAGGARLGVSAITGLAGDAFSTGTQIIGGAVRESLATQAIANRVAINARMPGQEGADPTELRKEFERAAVATPGISAQEIGKAAQAYVDLTGDLKAARENMQTFATVASATGASVEDVATAAASIGKQFGVKTQDDMKQVFAILTAQGKGGAMTMADMAAQLQRLAAAGKAFGIGEGVEGVTKLGGLLQMSRAATGSPRMAATATENILRQLDAKSAKLGIKQYDKSGKKMDVYENIAEVIAKEGGNDFARKHAGVAKFMGAQGMRGTNQALAAYEETYKVEKGKGASDKDAITAAKKAVVEAYQEAAKAATSFAEIEEDAAQAQMDPAVRLAGALSKLESAAGERLAPKLTEIATQLLEDGAVLDLFIKAVELAADGLEGLAAFAQQQGWLGGGSPKEKAEKAEKKEELAQKKVDQYAATLKTMGPRDKLSADRQGLYDEVLKKREAAEERVMSARKDLRVAKFEARQEELATTVTSLDGKRKLKVVGDNGEENDAQKTNRRKFEAGEGEWAVKAPPLPDVSPTAPGLTKEQREGREAMTKNVGGDGGAPHGGAEAAKVQLEASKNNLQASKNNLEASKRGPGSINGAPVVPGAAH